MRSLLYATGVLIMAIVTVYAQSEDKLSEETIIKSIPACANEKIFFEYHGLTSKSAKGAAEFLSNKIASGECAKLESDEPVQAMIPSLVDFHIGVIRKRDNREYFTYTAAVSEHWKESTVLRSALACKNSSDFLAYDNVAISHKKLANRFAAEKTSSGDCITLKQGEIIKLDGDGGWGYRGRSSLSVFAKFSRMNEMQQYYTYTDALVTGVKRHENVPSYENTFHTVDILQPALACKASKTARETLRSYDKLSGKEQNDFAASKIRAGECIWLRKGDQVRTESGSRNPYQAVSVIRRGDIQWYIAPGFTIWRRPAPCPPRAVC
jgi:hypothetical protein